MICLKLRKNGRNKNIKGQQTILIRSSSPHWEDYSMLWSVPGKKNSFKLNTVNSGHAGLSSLLYWLTWNSDLVRSF